MAADLSLGCRQLKRVQRFRFAGQVLVEGGAASSCTRSSSPVRRRSRAAAVLRLGLRFRNAFRKDSFAGGAAHTHDRRVVACAVRIELMQQARRPPRVRRLDALAVCSPALPHLLANPPTAHPPCKTPPPRASPASRSGCRSATASAKARNPSAYGSRSRRLKPSSNLGSAPAPIPTSARALTPAWRPSSIAPK